MDGAKTLRGLYITINNNVYLQYDLWQERDSKNEQKRWKDEKSTRNSEINLLVLANLLGVVFYVILSLIPLNFITIDVEMWKIP